MKHAVVKSFIMGAVLVSAAAAAGEAWSSPLLPACSGKTGMVIRQLGMPVNTRCASGPGAGIAGTVSGRPIVDIGILVSRDAPRACRLKVKKAGGAYVAAGGALRPFTFSIRSFPEGRGIKGYLLDC